MSKIINFSGGRTSAYMTKRLIDEGLNDYIVCFQNTGKEMPETLDFINECDNRWNLNIIWLEFRYGNNFEVVNYESASRNGRPFDELIAQNKGVLPNTMMRFCTSQMKINTLKRWAKSIGIKEWDHYVGIRYDEPRRWSKTSNLPKYMTVENPLVTWKTTKQEVLSWWSKQDFDLRVNEPYGNCDGCFLKGKGKLAIIAKEKPELLDWWIAHEKENTFKKEISYIDLKERSQAQKGIFDNDPSFSCFCNVD
jgi:3'-phosphoadenosine 5'-phosphosulfate sulfotransferase (PAPS reductase)/FAD synthetase